MGIYILKRLFLAVPTLFVASIVIFMLIHLAPGGPVRVMLGPMQDPVLVEKLRHQLGLDLIAQRFSVTMELAFLSLIVALLISIPTGIVSALRQDRLPDHIARVIALIGISIPNFFLGIILILIFGVYLLQPWGAGGFVPLSKSIMGQDYVRTARAMGIGQASIVRRDVVKNAMIPVITVMGNAIGYLLGGSIVTETVFRLPGVGNLIITGVFRRDYPVIQGIVLTIVVVRILVNLIVDLLYSYLDPRIRYGGAESLRGSGVKGASNE
jgi:peptide/nickel transport system permease protein